ncbi:MAG: O-antigen ligase family protein [Desulfatiglandaceae bacterium]
MKLERYLLLFILATMPVIYAAVQPRVWVWYAAAVYVTFLFAWWRNKVTFRENGLAAWLVYAFFAWTLFLLVPIPPELLQTLSPFRASILDQACEILGVGCGSGSVSYLQGLAVSRWSLWLAAFLLVMLVRAASRDGKFLKALVIMLLVVVAIEAFYGLIQALIPSTGVLGYYESGLGNARGSYINRNHFAGMIEMTWPLMLGYLLSLSPWEETEKVKLKHLINSDRFNRQLLMAIVLVVILLALVFSRSRAGITGGILGFVAFLGAMAFSGAGMRKGFWIGSGAAVVLLLIYGGQLGFDSVIERFMEIDENLGRLDKWRDAWLIIQQHPFGVGPGNYEIVEPVFQVNAQSAQLSIHTHNDYLQLLVETGWPGFLLLTAGWLYLLVRGLLGLRRFFRHIGYSRHFFLAAGAWSGLVSMAFHSFFDFNLQIPANLFFFAMLAGILTHVFHFHPHHHKTSP